MSNDVNDVVWDEGRKKVQNQYPKKGAEFSPTNYLNTRLEKGEKSRKAKIRIILTEDIDGKNKVAIPVEVHSLKLSESQNRMKKVSESGFKSFICLNDPHVAENGSNGCPLCDKKFALFKEANAISDPMEHKAMCKQAFGYDTKTAYIVRCIERGKEDEGVKFWRFNKRDDGTGIFDELMAMYITYRYPTDENGEDYMLYDEKGESYINPKYTMPADGEWENIFDYKNGRDINIVMTQSLNKATGAPDKTGIKLVVDPKRSPLSADEAQAEEWLNDDKDWRDMYRVKSYDFLKLISEDQTPVYNKATGTFVPYVDQSELDRQEQEIADELKYTPTPQEAPTVESIPAENTEDEEELPF